MKLHAARFKISGVLLLEALHFPDDARVLGITFDNSTDTGEITIDHHSLPLVDFATDTPPLGRVMVKVVSAHMEVDPAYPMVKEHP